VLVARPPCRVCEDRFRIFLIVISSRLSYEERVESLTLIRLCKAEIFLRREYFSAASAQFIGLKPCTSFYLFSLAPSSQFRSGAHASPEAPLYFPQLSFLSERAFSHFFPLPLFAAPCGHKERFWVFLPNFLDAAPRQRPPPGTATWSRPTSSIEVSSF